MMHPLTNTPSHRILLHSSVETLLTLEDHSLLQHTGLDLNFLMEYTLAQWMHYIQALLAGSPVVDDYIFTDLFEYLDGNTTAVQYDADGAIIQSVETVYFMEHFQAVLTLLLKIASFLRPYMSLVPSFEHATYQSRPSWKGHLQTLEFWPPMEPDPDPGYLQFTSRWVQQPLTPPVRRLPVFEYAEEV